MLVRPTAALSALLGTDAEVVPGDILDRQSLDRAMKGCDSVVHSAANTSQWPVHYSHYEPVNVRGTQNVIDACREHGISRVVYVSTANVFGPGTKEHPATELSEFSGFRYGSGYMISKYLAQQNVLMEVDKYKTPVVIVNPAFMIGPYDTKPSSGKIILMGLNKKMQVYPNGGKNFIHVRDAATGVCNALDRGRVGGCYLLANENLTYREFFEKLNQVAGQHPLKVRIPSAVLQTVGWIGTIIEAAGKKAAPLNHVNAKLLTIGNYYSGKKAVQELSLPQTPVENAITEAIEWFRRSPI
jgi:dihydroflavonol-4-reductase